MDSVKHVIPWTRRGQKEVLKSNGCESKICKNSCHTHSLLQVLQSLRRERVLSDIKLETDDCVIENAYKVVLISASPYFCAIFASFAKRDGNVVNLREFDTKILQRSVDYKPNITYSC